MSVKLDGMRNALSGRKGADLRQGLNSGGVELQPPITPPLYNQEKESSTALVLLQLVGGVHPGRVEHASPIDERRSKLLTLHLATYKTMWAHPHDVRGVVQSVEPF